MAGKTPLSQQVVVIAGGSYGLGRAIARAAADRGAKIVVGARTREALDAAVCEVEAAGSQGLAVEADVSRRGDVERLVRAAVERFGHVDTYVANAMVTVYAEAHRLADDELRRVMDVNFFGGVYGFWSALPHLTESQGTFIDERYLLGTTASCYGVAIEYRRYLVYDPLPEPRNTFGFALTLKNVGTVGTH